MRAEFHRLFAREAEATGPVLCGNREVGRERFETVRLAKGGAPGLACGNGSTRPNTPHVSIGEISEYVQFAVPSIRDAHTTDRNGRSDSVRPFAIP